MNLLLSVFRFLLAAVFLISGSVKAYDPKSFVVDIENYRLMLPSVAIVFTAYYLPWLEIAIGLSVSFKKFYRGALSLYFLLLTIFTIAIIAGLLRGLDISCGCFGSAISSGLVIALLRNIVLMAIVVFLWKKDALNGDN